MEVLIMDMNLIHLVDQHIQQDLQAHQLQFKHLDQNHVRDAYFIFLNEMNNKISYNLN